ncbi:LysR substrate-binding domain-containing protein [Janthinobacterium sp. NKUCC08_JDC]|uniref:LysR substrate-binding domain-containing protein n=1 Tax=Janthinobacterium sp. NKUCC08_JDC TaxID=2842122 RepID=UPI001C5B50E8|nr:LysR substrate-binding domain-containing protein [Janthinobacterium sp. NKUCC08_JDC]MBW3501172.1 LysR family transcriptional regulator [Janthinobacterium sp. NKUCC08_JDC]
MIETRLLRQFIAVAEELNFRRAAERLHMAQPPLSQAILRLEEVLGYPVFERTNRKVALTPAGSTFLATARQVLASLEEGMAAARRVAQGVEGHLRLSFIHITPYAHVLNALRAFRAASSAVQFTLREASTQQQVEWLERGEVDIALLRAPGCSTPGLRFERLSGEDIVIALPSDHHCAGQAMVDLADLAHDDFVASPRDLGQGFHDQLASLCLHAGFVPRVVQQARRLQTVLGLVAAGFGVALLPASLATSKPAGVIMLPLASSAPEVLRQLDLYMAWDPQRPSPVRERLLEQLRLSASH